MSRTETILRVFVASPSDVREERQLLEEIVYELNLTWSKNMGIRLELVKWETHAFPGMGDDAQAVINTEIDDDYDIFIGIMWTRFGSPTCRAESGTEEEFNKAYARYKENSDLVKIMFYFKDALIAPSEVDPVQLVAITNFKKKLEERGAFYWTYRERDEFESLLRLHLSRQVQSWLRMKAPAEKSTAQGNKSTDIPTCDVDGHLDVFKEEDEGFMDLFERAFEHFTRSMELLGQIGNETNSLTDKIRKHTTEMELLNKTGNFDFKAIKRINNNFAEDMRYFTSRIDADLPSFSESNKIAFDSIARAVTLFLDFNINDTSGLEGMLSTNEGLLTTFKGAENMTKSFRGTIAGLPRSTTDFSKAKRAAVAVMDKLIAEIASMGNMINEVNIVTRETIERASKKPSQSGEAL